MGICKFYSGASGIQTPIPKRDFPPDFSDKSRLTFYASLFNSIEINSSFYKMPMAKTLEKWTDSVAAPFKFTFKLWKGITHNKGLDFKTKDVNQFLRVIDSIGDKKGCLLVQFPPGLTVGAINHVTNLLTDIAHADENKQWKIAIEFRNKSWYRESVYELLDAYGAGLVIHDIPASAAPLSVTDNDFIYLRFHGPNGGYRGSYSDSFLYEYASYIQEWMEDGKIVYAYFNNTMGDALKNLMSLRKYANGDLS